MSAKNIRVLGVLLGDIQNEPSARTKYGLLFEAIGRKFLLCDVYDARLTGLDRFWNAVLTMSPNKQIWREKYYKNTFAFKLRSRRFAQQMIHYIPNIDLIFQVGVLFNANLERLQIPTVLYTDYTARLAADIPLAGRSPFNRRELKQWLALEQEAFLSAAHVCTRSHFVRKSVIRDYGISPERVTAVGGGVNFSPLPEPMIHPPNQPPTALFIGKEFYRKGGDLLLKAFAIARKEVPDARLIFMTTGRVLDGFPTEGVEQVEATWDREFIACLFRRADFLVLPSRLETWGDVLLEAMSYGIPCIGVAGQAMDEVIDDQQTGIIIPPEDELALAQALVILFTNPVLRQRWGQQARGEVETRFTWDCVVHRLAPVFDEIVSQYNSEWKQPMEVK